MFENLIFVENCKEKKKKAYSICIWFFLFLLFLSHKHDCITAIP